MMLDVPETSILNQNLRFVKNEFDDQLQEMFTESKEKQFQAPFKMVRPYPGICIKALKKGTKQKFFINICHTTEIPAPRDITESELQDLLVQHVTSEFRVPLSITKPRDGKDKSGNSVEISDVAINSDFYNSKIKKGDGLFYHFLITLVFESLEQKYQIEIDTNSFVQLKNRACIDKLVEHQIYSRNVEEVQKYHAKGGDDANESKKVLIQEIAQIPLPARKKSLPDINTIEPEHRLFSDRQKLIAEFHMPDVRDLKEIELDANDDRLVVTSKKYGYAFDGFLPFKINERKTLAEFDNERNMLKIVMSL